MFDIHDAAGIMDELKRARDAHGDKYIKINAYDANYGRQTTALSFIVNRPAREPGFRLDRQEGADRQVHYSTHAYALDRPEGSRYSE